MSAFSIKIPKLPTKRPLKTKCFMEYVLQGTFGEVGIQRNEAHHNSLILEIAIDTTVKNSLKWRLGVKVFDVITHVHHAVDFTPAA